VDWPTLAQLRITLGVTLVDAGRDALLEQALGAAIEQVHNDAGADAVVVTFTDGVPTVELIDDELEEPLVIDPVTASLSQAALLLAASAMKAPEAPHGVAAVFDAGGIYVARSNPHYQRLLVGNRQRFGVG
jgi:hypothetical protein